MATKAQTSATVVALGAALAVLGFAAFGLRCGGGDQQAAPGADGAEDRAIVADSTPVLDTEYDSGRETDFDSVGADAPSCVASDASIWSGWKNVPTPDCCDLAVPDSLSAVLQPLTWKPCSDATACNELDPASLGVASPTVFGARSSRGPGGRPLWLELDYGTDGSLRVVQFAIYDFATSSPVTVWRAVGAVPGRRCVVEALLGSRQAGLLAFTQPALDKWLAVGDPASLTVTPSFQSVSGGEVSDIQDVALSDTTFAFDVPLAGRILRTALGSGKYVLSPKTGFPPFLVEFAEKDDVFVESVHGTKGYGEEWRIDPDGTPVVVRVKDGRHISTFATDGTTLFWLESYGSTDVTAKMAREVWAAPYSTDAATLDATARKVASIPDGRIPVKAIAYGGIYAVISSYNASTIHVARIADGATKNVELASSPTPYGFKGLVYVSTSELWATTAVGTLRRYALGSW